MNGFVWNAKKPNEPQAVPREPRNSQIDRKSSDTTRPVDIRLCARQRVRDGKD